MKLLKILTALFLFSTPVFAFEDCIITNDSKLTDIRIENHDVIDVFPLITVSNEKNTLIVHPLKTGRSNFSVLKNDKNIVLFSVKVDSEKTTILPVDGFEILGLDTPPDFFEYELDFPPISEFKWNN